MSCPWPETSYPHLGTPSTDSLSLVWTYRKDKLVNVPANLLVEGDVIVLGTGQQCPAKVQQVFVFFPMVILSLQYPVELMVFNRKKLDLF